MLGSQDSQDLFSPEALALCKEKLKEQGYVNFMDLPDSFDYVRFLQQFGELMPQYDGNIIWTVKYDPTYEEAATGLGSLILGGLPPHTECYELEGLPPNYLALWCVKPAEGGGGETTLADGYTLIASLTKDEQHQLYQTICEFRGGPRVAHHPIYDPVTYPMEPIIRFSTKDLNDKGDPFIMRIRQRFAEFFAANHEPIAYKKNSLLLWDNWRMLHGRTDYQDPSRELKRVWISKSA
jgi:alpha-ketoglutarate-dependent taurine dioxygenase